MPHAATVRRWCPLVLVACATVCTIAGLVDHGGSVTVRAEDRPPADSVSASETRCPKDTGFLRARVNRSAPSPPAPLPRSGGEGSEDTAFSEIPPSDGAIQLVAFRADARDEKSPEEILDETVPVREKGSSSAAARKAAAAALPLDQMAETDRQRVRQVLDSLSLFRELPLVEFESDPACCRFFSTHPDVAASIWRVMKISKFQMWQTGRDQYEIDAGDGTVGVVDVLVRGPGQSVILCEGTYTSPLLAGSIKATALFHLQTRFGKDAQGRDVVQGRLSMFVAFPSQAVEAAARLVSPLSNMIIDRNFREVCLFVSMMSRAMQRQPGWVEQVAARLEGVMDARKPQLVEVTMQVYLAARQRELSDAADRTRR